jgi:hypothetical protein
MLLKKLELGGFKKDRLPSKKLLFNTEFFLICLILRLKPSINFEENS